MPLYEYQCRDCEKPFEAFVTTDRRAACPSCGSEDLAKLLSRPGMVGVSESRAEACEAPAPQGPMCGARGGACGCMN